MIAVFGALREEVAYLRRRMRVEDTVAGPTCRVFRGTYLGRELVLVQTGLGKERAETAARFILDRYPITSVVSLGFAGALDDKLCAGDVVLYSSVCCAQTETALDAHSKSSYRSDDGELAMATQALASAAVDFACGGGVTVQQVVLSPEEKGELADTFDTQVVDMESYWIAKIASEMGIPFVVIRSISDTRQETLLPFDQMMTEDGKVLWRAAAAYFVRRPQHLVAVGRLYRNARLAQTNLATAIDSLIAGP